MFKKLTRQSPTETSNVTGLLQQLNSRFLSRNLPMKTPWADRQRRVTVPSGENISLLVLY